MRNPKGSTAECFNAVSLVAAVPELVAIQANKQSVMTRVIVHNFGIVLISALDDLASRASQHLLFAVTLPAKTATCGEASFVRHILLAF